jgi:hypothetical protein
LFCQKINYLLPNTVLPPIIVIFILISLSNITKSASISGAMLPLALPTPIIAAGVESHHPDGII